MHRDITGYQPSLRRRISLAFGLGIAVVALIVGRPAALAQSSAPDKAHTDTTTKPVGNPGEAPTDPNMPIQSDFLINVTVVGESEPSGNYRVDPAGNVSIRYANIETPISVRGQTADQVRDRIVEFLKSYVKSPQVTVKLVSVPQPVVWVTGAVHNSGQLQVPTGTTLVDVLTRAEWTDNADLSQIRLIRREIIDGKEVTKSRPIAFDKYLSTDQKKTPDESLNVVLQDRDRIFVPLIKAQQGNQTISVQGEVVKAAMSIPYRATPPMTVREAISIAGGLSPNANPKMISIQRADLERPLVIDFLKANDGDPLNNVELKANDAVYVERLSTDAFVNLNGGFVKPSKMVYNKSMTLIQAVNEVGGPAPAAKLNSGRIFRNPDGDPAHTKVIAFNWNDIQNGKAKDIALLPGDSISLTPGVVVSHPDIWGVLNSLTGPALVLYDFIR